MEELNAELGTPTEKTIAPSEYTKEVGQLKEIIKELEKIIKEQELEIEALKQQQYHQELATSSNAGKPATNELTFTYGEEKFQVVSGVFMRTTGSNMESLTAEDVFNNKTLREHLADYGSSCIQKL